MVQAMPRKSKKPKTTRPKGDDLAATLDPRVHEFARSVERLAKKRGVNKNQLAIRTGIDPAHLGKWYKGTAGFSAPVIMDILQALGAAWAIESDDPDNPRHLPLVGVMAGGMVRFLGKDFSMPAVFQVDGAMGPFSPGDRVVIEKGEWDTGRWVVVRHPGGDVRVHLCEMRGGLRLLVGTEAFVFDEAAHEIVGVITDHIIRR
jgi:transcriptional regulator with XRE-family HTH domain